MNVKTSVGKARVLELAIGQDNACRNEVLWTLLVADLLADERTSAVAAEILCGAALERREDFAIWLEAQPMSPRKREGNSEIDLAFGSIAPRGSTSLGIEPGSTGGPVCFCEAKVLSDCSTTVANDLTRNQLARALENLLTFQAEDRKPDSLTFALLTPRFFRDEAPTSRLYGYKYREYTKHTSALLADIARSSIDRRQDPKWSYPVLDPRLERLRFHWATYEDVLALDPDLGDVDVVEIAMSGNLPDSIAGRMHQAVARLQTTVAGREI